MTLNLNSEELNSYKKLMETALAAARDYDGSEVAERRLFIPLLAMDQFIRNRNSGLPSAVLEKEVADLAWPNRLEKLASFNDFLGKASEAFKFKVKETKNYEEVISLLALGGAVVKHHPQTFVQTDDGELQAASLEVSSALELKTQPRLAMLLQRLKQEGIYTDDIIVHVCTPDKNMMRKLPYIVLHIPRLDKEIAVCDQVGEITFVANKSLGTDVWTYFSKNQLKARPEISAVRFSNEEEWWSNIRQFLIDKDNQIGARVNIQVIAGKKPPLDLALLKACIYEHRKQTGFWPKIDSGMVLHGPYAGKIKWKNIQAALHQGVRGLPGGSSLAEMNEVVSNEFKLDYENPLKKENLDPEKIKACIYEHRMKTGQWPTDRSKIVLYGSYAGNRWSSINTALVAGLRGLPGGSSLWALNKVVSDEHHLDYVNVRQLENFELDKVKACIYEHRMQTGFWPKIDSGTVQYGPYAGKTEWKNIQTASSAGVRGLPGGSSLSRLNEEVSREYNLDYVKGKHLQRISKKQLESSKDVNFRG